MTLLWSDNTWRVEEKIFSLPDGREKKTVYVTRPHSVHILAFKNDDTLLMLREYRPLYGEYIWMLPSGRVDKETNIAEAAQRELQEETGFKAASLQYYCETNYSESLKSTNYLFIAKDLSPSPLPQDADELIEVHELTPEQALQNILQSPKVHTASAYGLLRYLYEQ